MAKQDQSNQKKTSDIFNAFLLKYNATVGSISEDSVLLNEIIASTLPLPMLTKFRALDDTLLYANLLTRLLDIVPPTRINTLIDFGAGSSIPTIKALLNSPTHDSLKIIAVDDDSEAIKISKKNVTIFKLFHRYNYFFGDMFDFLSKWELKAEHVVAANPPYAPTPPGIIDPFFHPSDGGWDGIGYIEPLLSHSMPSKTLVALRWCSLDNPIKIISIIKNNYDVLHLDAYCSPFGTYTGAAPLKDHLEKLRELGISVFTVDDDGRRKFISLGCILRRR